ncbi:hypothetical protein LSH36_195g07026 [Paralvinella palmiformis]|uniref:3-hydroxyanthranilate 3,4-dioxygenase n=1 Tax=Paralvinella palmiformis TaxID=53620 RepID=A0AAD9N4Y3_9ANNE|nr:hypothetical protein LSH36_195g07026 [Paralvinella palmiformis]
MSVQIDLALPPLNMSPDVDPVLYNVSTWLEQNKQHFLPPVCNKMMHGDGQMKLFFVGGPNQRKDYHVECGEELFYQLKGDMILKVVEKGVPRDVHIKEGEIFLLPCCIQHSPQRFANTIGLVIERERHLDMEKDGLRYFVEENGKPTDQLLYEKWFYCEDLGTQLAPIINGFFQSEQHKTGKPIPGTIAETIPLTLDMNTELVPPFSLNNWMKTHNAQLDDNGKLALFDCDKHQFQVYIFGKGENSDKSDVAEAWLWQQIGESAIEVDGNKYVLKRDDSLLIPVGKRFTVSQTEGCRTLVCYQDQTKAATWPKRA